MRTRKLFVPFAALSFFVVSTDPAHAALTVTFSPVSGFYHVVSTTLDSISVSCNNGNTQPASAPNAPCAAVEAMLIEPGIGLDSVSLANVTTAAFPSLANVRIDALPNDNEPDSLTGSALADFIEADFTDIVIGGDGDDVIHGGDLVIAGNGNDTIEDSGGDQGIDGGAGDDRFIDSNPPGGIEGGSGYDTVELDLGNGTGTANLALTLDSSGLTAAPLDGGPGAIKFAYANIEHFQLTLYNYGTQKVDLSAFPGDAVVNAEGGTDTLIGTHRSDLLRGGGGNDTIDARDGVVDIVDCGGDVDTATVDAIDVVMGCETVTLPDTSAISGPGKVKKGKKAKYTFSATVAGSTFQCAVDNKPFKACASPFTVKTKKLALGKHKLQVKAAGDLTPSVKKFKVKKP